MARDQKKVPFSVNKRHWHPSVLPGQIVLVSTEDQEGQANIAPKSWVTMVAARGPVVAFGCNVTHKTYQGILTSRAFVINVPDASLANRIWGLMRYHGVERVERSGFTLVPAHQVAAPIIAECRAHLECVYDSEKRYGDEVMIFGRMVMASVDADCLVGDPPQQYFSLRPVFFLEGGLYGTLDTAYRVGAIPPVDHPLFLVEVGDPTASRDVRTLLEQHVSHLRQLRKSRRLLMSGAFETAAHHDEGVSSGLGSAGGGMYIVSAPSLEDANAMARQDPLVVAGAPFIVRAWRRSF
jgi:flavin reductase (DIM6/NTAB) family NADH-FMN oxidoreductase RutF/uncharacterized protein YciI